MRHGRRLAQWLSRRARVLVILSVVLGSIGLSAPSAQGAGVAPGGPGATALWTAGNKDGFGSSTTTTSKVWFTLGGGGLTEMYYPDLGTPAVRDLRFAITDGSSFVSSDRDGTEHDLTLLDPRSLTYRQSDVDTQGRWRLTTTYVTDPLRPVVLVRVHFESSTGRPLRLYALFDPSLSNGGDDDSGSSVDAALVAQDARAGSAVIANPAFTKTSSGYLGTSDGWTDLRDYRMDWTYASAPNGNVAQTGRTALTGVGGNTDLTLAIGFGSAGAEALSQAQASLAGGFDRAMAGYQRGWHDYLNGLERPRSAAGHEALYDVSVMALAAMEDKTYRGAMVAAPSMAWVWGQIPGYSGPYHLVWARDAYEMATARLAAGDRAAAERAVRWLWTRQQQPDGCFPQNSTVDGTPHWPNLQLDEVADVILLAGQLRHQDAFTWSRTRLAAGCILANGPQTQERWENAVGYSPASIATQIAGLVVAAEIADANGDHEAANLYRGTADSWRAQLRAWTVTDTGTLSARPYFVRLTVDGNASAGTQYTLADGGPTVDQRSVVDPSFLELVRLGVLRADDPDITSTLPVVDGVLGVSTPNGTFWHRYNGDGYGETPEGADFPGPGNTGRLWPIFAGERAEYELALGGVTGNTAAAQASAAVRLDAMSRTANDGLLLPEQVWDRNPPAPAAGYLPGTPTRSSAPLGWTHAQFVRLAWSIDAGRPVEQPDAVAARYLSTGTARTPPP